MDKFESSFEQMDVTSSYVEQAMNSSAATATDEGAVDSLIAQMQAGVGLEIGNSAASAGSSEIAKPVGQSDAGQTDEAALEARLAALRQ